MNNYLSISQVNPLELFDKARTLLPQYNTKFNDDFTDRESRKIWQGPGCYFQKWQFNDAIFQQFVSNVAPIKIQTFDCNGLKVGASLQFTQKQQNRFVPGMYIYEGNLALNFITKKGRYRFEITIGDPILKTLESDWVDIAPLWDNTVLIEFTNSFYYADAVFGTGWNPNIRVEGWFKDEAPASKDEIYTDQVYNQTMIFSDPFRVRQFIIGPGSGVPDWMPQKLNWILGCDSVFIDGRGFTKADSAQFKAQDLDVNYPYRGWSINLQDSLRRSSKVFPIDPTAGGKKLLVALNVETQGFADTTLGSASNVIQIASVDVNE